MTSLILILHIFGALVTGGVIIRGIYEIILNSSKKLSHYSRLIAILGCFEIVSGSLFTFLSANQSVFLFCKRISIYVLVLAIIEVVFYIKLKNPQFFPKKAVAYSSLVSTFVTLITIFQLI